MSKITMSPRSKGVFHRGHAGTSSPPSCHTKPAQRILPSTPGTPRPPLRSSPCRHTAKENLPLLPSWSAPQEACHPPQRRCDKSRKYPACTKAIRERTPVAAPYTATTSHFPIGKCLPSAKRKAAAILRKRDDL